MFVDLDALMMYEKASKGKANLIVLQDNTIYLVKLGI